MDLSTLAVSDARVMDSDFRDCMLSGSLRFDPTPSSALGPAVVLTPSWGASSSGFVGLERTEDGINLPASRATTKPTFRPVPIPNRLL